MMQSITKAILGAGVAFAAVSAVPLTVDPTQAAGEATAVQLAQNDAAAIIVQRQGLMKSQGDHAAAINGFVEEDKGTVEDVAKRAADLQRRSSEIAALFPAGTGIDDNVAKTAAKMDIWARPDEFKAAAANLGDLAGALWAAAAGGDKQQVADAFAKLGKEGCGGCHQTFRQKED
jgi:cytochrome c556